MLTPYYVVSRPLCAVRPTDLRCTFDLGPENGRVHYKQRLESILYEISRWIRPEEGLSSKFLPRAQRSCFRASILTAQIKNMNLNTAALNEYLKGLPLEIVRGYVSSIRVSASIAHIRSEPVVVKIERIEIELAEPGQVLPPSDDTDGQFTPSVLEGVKEEKDALSALLKKTVKRKKKNYQLLEKVADGVRIEIGLC